MLEVDDNTPTQRRWNHMNILFEYALPQSYSAKTTNKTYHRLMDHWDICDVRSRDEDEFCVQRRVL